MERKKEETYTQTNENEQTMLKHNRRNDLVRWREEKETFSK